MFAVWVWRSLVARLNGVQEAGGSNPLTQTNVAARRILKESRTKYRLSFFCRLRLLFPKNLTSQSSYRFSGALIFARRILKESRTKYRLFLTKDTCFLVCSLFTKTVRFLFFFSGVPEKRYVFWGVFIACDSSFPKILLRKAHTDFREP